MGREEIVKEIIQDSEKSEVGMRVQVVRKNVTKEQSFSSALKDV